MRIDRSQFTLATALRSSVGVFLPLMIGVMTGYTIEGVSIAAGAIGVGAIGLTYTYRARTRTMLFACLAIAFSVLIGGLIGISDWLTVLVVALWGFGAGLLVAVSPGATRVGVQATLMLILLTHFRLNPLQSLTQAGLILSGALFQTLLALIPSPWLRFGSESATIATVYHALADFVQAPEDPAIARLLNESLLQVEAMVSDSSAQSRKEDALGRLFADAEHIRLDLVLVVEIKRYLQDEPGETIPQLMQATATILRGIAKRCQHETAVVDVSAAYQQIAAIVASLRTQNKFLSEHITFRQIAAYCKTLSRHLRHAEESVQLWQDVRRHISFSWIVPRHPRLQLHDPLTIVRANLSLHSTACRHAIRLAVVLVLATVLYRFSPLTRGYWVPITALFVLKPDFATTFNNSSTRSLGTILGAVLTSLILVLLQPAAELRAVTVGILAFLAYSFLNVNYALFSLFMTALVVLVLAYVDPQPAITVFYRALDTTIGASFALLAYIFWPTWEVNLVGEKLAARLDAQRHYFAAVMNAFIDPSRYNAGQIEQLRRAARLARSNAEASVQRALNEPARRQGDPDIIYGLLVASDSLAKGLLGLEAQLYETPERQPLPELKPFAEEVSGALEKLSASIRQGELLEAPVKLTLHRLEGSRKAIEARGGPVADLTLLALHCASIVHGINMLNRLLSVHSGSTDQLAAASTASLLQDFGRGEERGR
jgi:uncharacterized membrane protein YccC